MLKKGINIFLFLLLNLSFGFSQNISTGEWSATLKLTEQDKLPFKLVVEKINDLYKLLIFNAEEKIILSDVKNEKDSIIASFSEYNSQLIFKESNNELDGYWINHEKKNYKLPFHATKGYTQRFPTIISDSSVTISGKWKVYFNPRLKSEFLAVGVFKQDEEKLRGTFLTETGDFRFLEGNQYGKDFLLSCFDGSHAFLFKAKVKNDSLIGRFLSGKHYEGKWVGVKDEKIELSDPYSLTKFKNDKPIEFEAKNLDGTLFYFPRIEDKNKVTIIQIMGTWCPNCLDETKFYKELYSKYHSKGLEIITVGFEAGENFETNAMKLNRFKQRNGVDFTFLLGGSASKNDATKVFTMIEEIKSFPTSIYVGKDGMIKKIHTGFSGPGTGMYYEKQCEETFKLIDSLLKE